MREAEGDNRDMENVTTDRHLPHSIFDFKSALAGGSYVSIGWFTKGSELGKKQEGERMGI